MTDPTGQRAENIEYELVSYTESEEDGGWDLIDDEDCLVAHLTASGFGIGAFILGAFLPVAAFAFAGAVIFEAVVLVDCELLP